MFKIELRKLISFKILIIVFVNLMIAEFSLWANADDEIAQNPYWANFHFQNTEVSQQHGSFNAPYSGQNSLSPSGDNQTSTTTTIFAGFRLSKNTELYLNPEMSGGSGFNKTQGIAGFPSGEIYRVDDPNPKWSWARMYLKQIFELGGDQEEFKDDKNQLAAKYDQHRFTVVLGKFALNDFFDNNTYSHDPRTQFLNWALMDNGGWDYASDTRGYSWGLYLEYNEADWALRFSSVQVATQANQMKMDSNFPTMRGDNLELEWRYKTSGLPGATRFLLYENHANMGNYLQAINTAQGGTPDIVQSRSPSVKYGFGVNLEQAFDHELGGFLRTSWNNGQTETWAFTEIDQALSLGVSSKGSKWRRANDTFGIAFIWNEISSDHKGYLQAGGYGFIVGDGALSYAPERILESYYLFKVTKNLEITIDNQYIQNPAYNSDRGPLNISSLRVHFEN
jgi:high affinity Mn2+ porin